MTLVENNVYVKLTLYPQHQVTTMQIVCCNLSRNVLQMLQSFLTLFGFIPVHKINSRENHFAPQTLLQYTK